MPSIAFRPLSHVDLPTLHRWFAAPHVARWFGAPTPAEVDAQYGGYINGVEAARPFVVSVDGRDVGLVVWQFFGDFPEAARLYGVDDPNATNCDMLLGERDLTDQGLGPLVVRAFLERVVFADPRPTTCILDPVPDNAVAIRAYEKAGFRFLRAMPDDGEGNALYLMELRRDDLARAVSTPPFHLRPGRPGEIDLACAIDDDACTLYQAYGLAFVDEDFMRHEAEHWGRALGRGRMLFACTAAGEPVGFIAFDLVDGLPFIWQISVRVAHGRRGVGRMLLDRVRAWSVRAGEVWLTTYDHVPWNAPFYHRYGFRSVERASIGPELADVLGRERVGLPAPEHRVVMRLSLR